MREYELVNLTEVSGTVESILDVRNENGRRQYGYSNIKKILGVAILSPNQKKPKKYFPPGRNYGNQVSIPSDKRFCRMAKYLTVIFEFSYNTIRVSASTIINRKP